jgi:uncharacterized alpha-E superfamily protein
LAPARVVPNPGKTQRTLGTADLVRSDPFLPSRVVENLFWFGRYAERCEGSARLLRIMLARYVDDDDDPQALQSALALAQDLGLLADPEEGELEARLLQALLGSDWPASLRANLQRLQWAAGSVRGKLSRPTGRRWSSCQREAQLLEDPAADFGELLDFLNRLLMSLAALSGFALDDMTRDDGWRFLMFGRYIERLQFLCDSFAGFLRSGSATDQSALEWLLELGNSSITYRTRYLASAQLIPVLDLLLLDEKNPHAVLFQLRTLLRSLQGVSERFELPAERYLAYLEEQLTAFKPGQPGKPVVRPRQHPCRARGPGRPAGGHQRSRRSGIRSPWAALLRSCRCQPTDAILMSRALYQVLHDTHYRYSAPVSLAQQLAHLWPRECPWQRCQEKQLRIDPQPCQRRDGLDVFGNPLTRLVFERPHEALSVSARLRVEVLARPPLALDDSPSWEAASAALSYSGTPMEPALLEASRYRFESPYVRLKQVFADFADDCFTPRAVRCCRPARR